MARGDRGEAKQVIVHLARDQRREPTSAEMRLWRHLQGRRLAGLKFRRQHPFGPYILDFFCVEHSLVIEVDGDIHDLPDQKAYDLERTRFLEEQELRVIRFPNDQIIDNLPEVLQSILKEIQGINEKSQESV